MRFMRNACTHAVCSWSLHAGFQNPNAPSFDVRTLSVHPSPTKKIKEVLRVGATFFQDGIPPLSFVNKDHTMNYWVSDVVERDMWHCATIVSLSILRIVTVLAK